MGISAGGGGHGPKHDINVTPLVDVVLVMLIIFLLAMPIQIRKIAIEVPKELEADVISVSDAVTVNLIGKADGSLIINDGRGDSSITRTELAKKIHSIFDKTEGKERVIFVDFEDPTKYGDVISIMDTVRGAVPKKTIDMPDGKRKTVPDVKIALTIRDADRRNKPRR